MAAIEAIIYNGFHTRGLGTYSDISNSWTPGGNYYPPGYLLATGLTAGETYVVKTLAYNYSNQITSVITAGRFTAAATKGLAPFASFLNSSGGRIFYGDYPVTASVTSLSLLAILTDASVTVATAFISPRYPYSHNKLPDWSVTQAGDKSVIVSLQSLNTVTSYSVLYSLTDSSSYNSPAGQTKPLSQPIYTVAVLDNQGTQLATADVHWPKNGSNPVVTFPSSTVVTSGNHVVKISNVVVVDNNAGSTTLMSQEIQTALTALTVTSGGGENTNMFSALSDTWWLTDLQVNLSTRAVTHRHGTVEIRPNDTVNFAVFFHDGSAGVNPQATDLRLAVRSSANTSAYHFWSAATVTTASLDGDTYYAITVTASDEDLLSGQVAALLAGSNAAQSLIGEIQWTTTRGTFTSNTFAINAPSEVVREPDV